VEAGTTLNKEERNALIGFLVIYVVSAMVLVGIIAFLYYKKESMAIENHITMEMANVAMRVEKELMSAEMAGKPYTFSTPSAAFQVGLFDANETTVFSNLRTDTVEFSKGTYKSNSHEYYVAPLKAPVLGVNCIVIEGDQGLREKYKLLALLGTVVLFSAVFIALVGYFLSKLLIAPIKSRMEKLNAFIRDSSHDLNTPVSALMMSVSSLRNKPGVDGRVLNHISISAKLISQIYNSLSFIAFYDVDTVFDEYFDLKDTVQESVRFFDEIALTRGNTIHCELEKTMVFMDKSRIQKVLNNLLSNALKYSFAQSEIRITLAAHCFRIEDKGIGIKAEDKEAIFNRFERKNTSVGGFGIGLDIVKSVCKHYAITIAVHSTPEVGTTFELCFPKPENVLDPT